MTITLYDITVPVCARAGPAQRGTGEGAGARAAAGIAEAALLEARLVPGMLTLAGQVQRASDTAKFAAVRIGGVENVSFADEERSFDELQERIGRTRAFWRRCRGRRSTAGRARRSPRTWAGRQ